VTANTNKPGPQLQAHIAKLRRDMRHAYAEYGKFDIKWNELNDELNHKFRAEGRTLEVVAQGKAANVTLQSYMSAAVWWRDKAQALATLIVAEQAAYEMLGTT
jgi:hypothetical protein